MSRPFSTTHTTTSLNKMNTERLHRLYTHIYGVVLFNPYEERQMMLVALGGHFDTRTIEQQRADYQESIIRRNSLNAQYDQMMSSRKYTNSQIRSIRIGREAGVSFRELAAIFEGSLKGIEKICKRQSYQDVY